MAINIQLKVTPEQLKTQKTVIDADMANIRSDIAQITSELEGTSAYWLGEAGEKQRKDYADSLQKIGSMLDRLDTYPARILQMAGIYEETESVNTQTGSQLKAEVELI